MPLPPPVPPSSDGPLRALVIDDSELARSFLSGLLAEAGFEVTTQASAIGATRTIVHERIQVVVVDVSMPGLNGDKLVGVLRSNPRLQGLIIVVVSSQPQEVLDRIAAETAADAVVSKDGVEHRLVPLIQRLVNRRESVTGVHAMLARSESGKAQKG